MEARPPLRGDESPEALVEFMDRHGYNWRPDERRFVPRRDGPAAGRLPLNVFEALEMVDPRYVDQSGDIRNLPPPRWPVWLRR